MQSLEEIEEWYKTKDPWKYEKSKDDSLRKDILLSALKSRSYDTVLDVGCGQGFITRDLPGKSIIGVDVSSEAIKQAKKYETDRIKFRKASIFQLNKLFSTKFDLIIITGVLYQHYIGKSLNLIYLIIDSLLNDRGYLVSVHINSWYKARFPYLLVSEHYYDYREYIYQMEVYKK